MFRVALAVAALVVLVAGAAAPAVAAPAPVDDDTAAEPATPPDVRVVALHANPVADGDAGEYVVLEASTPTNLSGWTLEDGGQDRARLPNATVEGRAVVSVDPDAVAEAAIADASTDAEVLALTGRLRLANGGEELVLRRNGTVVDAVAYDRAPEGELWHRAQSASTSERDASAADDPASGNWAPLGATDFDPASADVGAVTAFALPDDPETPVGRIERADERILLGGYTFADERVAEALIDARERGVRVEVAVEGSPVGGTTVRQARLLDDLAAAGVRVVALGGERARYRYHHPKYAVVDDEAIVLTENWKPAGTGGRSSRGWGVVVHDETVAAELATVFDADADSRGAVPWTEYRSEVEPIREAPANGTYPRRFDAERVDAETVRVLTAPDNAEGELRDLIAGADESVRITQVSIGGRENPLLQAALEAARRGVEVRILLSSAWYVEEDNRALANWLETRAARENLDLQVKLADPRGRYEKIHAKGVVIDEETVVVGSVNWNTNSLRENREVAVVIEGSEPGEYYADLFLADWRGGERLPVGLVGALLVAAAGATAVARRRVTFEKKDGSVGD